MYILFINNALFTLYKDGATITIFDVSSNVNNLYKYILQSTSDFKDFFVINS